MKAPGARSRGGDPPRRVATTWGAPRAFVGVGRGAAVGALAIVCLGACASSAARALVDAPAATHWTEDARVAREVGRLLGGDAAASRAAEAVLLALDDAGRASLLRHAARVPTERDRRWLHILDAYGRLPALSAEEAVDLRLWQALRTDPGSAARGRAALAELARRDPAPLLARLSPDAPGAAVIALALADAHAVATGPAILDLYVAAPTPALRRAAAAALDRLVAPARGPDPDALGLDLVAEAARVASLVRDRAAREAPRSTP